MKVGDQKYTDDFEKRCCELIKKLTKTKFKNNAVVFREAANQIIKSANPESQEIYNFMFGMSKQHEAKSEKDPKKAYARGCVGRAIRKGTLKKQPCHCGEVKVQGHHEDYNKPLKVEWLCIKHHRKA